MFDTIVIAIGVLAAGAVLYSFGEYLWPTNGPSIRVKGGRS